MSAAPKIGLVAGSYDPMTHGHTCLVKQSAKLMDRVVVAIGANAQKKTLFTADERMALCEATLRLAMEPDDFAKVSVEPMGAELLANFARAKKAQYILRGIRSPEDFAYESKIQMLNSKICPEIETIFFLPPRDLLEVSSSLVKGLMASNGWEDVVRSYVSEPVMAALQEKRRALFG